MKSMRLEDGTLTWDLWILLGGVRVERIAESRATACTGQTAI